MFNKEQQCFKIC